MVSGWLTSSLDTDNYANMLCEIKGKIRAPITAVNTQIDHGINSSSAASHCLVLTKQLGWIHACPEFPRILRAIKRSLGTETQFVSFLLK